tara:strand:+ start:81401 stop:81949 length:549 start_codon:yes stop_codon:yes gene_type:complete
MKSTKKKLFTIATLLCFAVFVNAQTTGLTDNFSNEDTSGELVQLLTDQSYKTSLKDSVMQVHYKAGFGSKWKEIRYNAPNNGTFNLSASGKSFSMDVKSTVAYPIYVLFIGEDDKVVSGAYNQTFIADGAWQTIEVNGSADDAFSKIKYLKIFVNPKSEVDESGILYIDNLVIGDGSFKVTN